MKIKFNKFEKIAGLFVGFAMIACVAGAIGIAVKKGWFSTKVRFSTEIETADGVHSGTLVQIAGLRVGAVTDVELQANDRVLVHFEILEKFRDKVKQDSHVQMFRPFILAEKVLEVSVGSETSPILEVGQSLPMKSSMDLMDLLSGKSMSTMLSSFDNLAESLRVVGEAFSDPKRTKALVQMLDRLNPMVENLNRMSVEVVKVTNTATKKQRLENILSGLSRLSQQLEVLAPQFAEEVPDIGRQMGQIVKNLNILTTEFQKLTPAIAAIAPDLPRTSQRAVEALDETVVLLKAMQRSFFFRGKVQEVREEETRQPAAQENQQEKKPEK